MIARQTALAFFLFIFSLLDSVPSKAVQYTVTGMVTSTIYGSDGTVLKKDLSPGIPSTSTCGFTWYRKDDKWRLDIMEPSGNDRMLKSIMPYSSNSVITIASYLRTRDHANSKENVYALMSTNRFVVAENMYGESAVWMTFDSPELLRIISPDRKSVV